MSAAQGPPPRALVVVTGDELLRGFIADVNGGWLAAQLRQLGIELAELRLVGDSRTEIAAAIEGGRATTAADMVIVTGGLGPTHDDRTTEAVAGVLDGGLELELRPDALEVVEARVRAYGRMKTPEDAAVFAPGNAKQATFPRGAEVLDAVGTAPGYVLRGSVGDAASDVVVVVLPGPPGELRHAWRHAVATAAVRERVLAHVPDQHERLVRIWGVPESRASAVLADLDHVDSASHRVTLCAREGELEVSMRGSDGVAVDDLVLRLVDRFEGAAFAVDDERPVAAIVGDLLGAHGWMLGTAESCTGGMLGALLTDVAGSSSWYVGGVVAYADEIKVAQLGVEPGAIAEHGAVSEQVALAMAAGACEQLGCQVGVGVTGVAGPGGGTERTPVGTVHIAASAADGRALHRRMTVPGDRATVRRRSSVLALHLLRELLEPGA